MLDTLKEYLNIYKREKDLIESTSDEEAIKKEVAEFEAELRKDYALKKAKKIEVKEYQIATVEDLISREEQKLNVSEVVDVEIGTEETAQEIASEESNPFANL